ncbi:hypothetical protein VTN00DRAFT_658 [Thermoascus crustaceus]|uniref:uncharacterized protein n=1 Tax=Thermoascus crustaceus TaxID=5088 RepID=UPI0037424174
MDHMDMHTGMATAAMSTGMHAMTSTASAAMASSTGMDMGGMSGMGGMSMGHGGGSECQMSMLWNWNTIDACFISKYWHITSHGMFGGSCIGVICLVIVLEFLRRVGREYDAYIIRRARVRRQIAASSAAALAAGSGGGDDTPSSSSSNKGVHANVASAGSVDNSPIRPNLLEQLVRAVLHMAQFAVAYFIMLLAMYYNGYIIICIFIGAFLGAFIFSWEPIATGEGAIDATSVTKCCG